MLAAPAAASAAHRGPSGDAVTDAKTIEPIEPGFSRRARLWLCGATAASVLLPLLRVALSDPWLFLMPLIHGVLLWAVVLLKARKYGSASMRARLRTLSGEPAGSDGSIGRHRVGFRSLYTLQIGACLPIVVGWLSLIVTRGAA